MHRRAALAASTTALVALVAWWGSILYLDGILAAALPYDQYEMVALLYPDVFYPGLPGWMLAHAQPFSIGVFLVAIGWMLTLSGAIGVGAAWYAAGRRLSSTVTAGAVVVALFVVVTAGEAVTILLICYLSVLPR